MSLPAGGPYLVFAENPNNGKQDFTWDATGNPVFGDDPTELVLSCIVERQGDPPNGQPHYWADPSGKRGSLIYTVKNDLRATPSKVKALAEAALEQLVQAQKIVKPAPPAEFVTVTRIGPGRFSIIVNFSKPGGAPLIARATLPT